MRKNNQIMKKQCSCSVGLMTAFIIFVIVVLAIISVFSLVISTDVTYAQAFVETELLSNSISLEQVIVKREDILMAGRNLSFMKYVEETNINNYENISFSYVLCVDFSSYETFSYSNDVGKFKLGYCSDVDLYKDRIYLSLNESVVAAFTLSSSIDVSALYLTFSTESGVVVTYEDFNKDAGYENSFSNAVFDFGVDSDVYLSLYQILYGSKYSGATSFNYKATTCSESFMCKRTLPIPEKQGYTFIGWFYDEECTIPYLGEVIDDDINLYAGFEKTYCTVTFYVENKVWKQVEVEIGSSFKSILSCVGVDKNNVVGYENLNKLTQVMSIDEFVIEDDVLVYLTAVSSEDILKDFVSSWNDFLAKFKLFFERIKEWFKNLFSFRRWVRIWRE